MKKDWQRSAWKIQVKGLYIGIRKSRILPEKNFQYNKDENLR